MIQHAAKLFAIVILIASCTQEKNYSHLQTLTKTLERSNALMKDYNDLRQRELEDVLWRPYDTEGHYLKVARGRKVREISASLISYVDKLHGSVVQGKTNELFQKLVQYKHDLLSLITPEEFTQSFIFQETKKRFFEEIPVVDFIKDSNALSTASSAEEKWIHDTFITDDTLLFKASLLKIKNDILVSEQIFLKHFHKQPVVLVCGLYGYFSALAFMNSSCIQSGDSIEVIAGIGTFTAAVKPRIIINGKEISLCSDASAVYNFQPRGKPGKYSIPVEIEFYKPDGTQERIFKNLHYTIAQ